MDYTSPKAIAAKSVVDSGRFELADFLDKLDVIWLHGDMSKEERDALTGEAREKADPMGALPGVSERLAALEVEVGEMQARLDALESAQDGGEGGETEPEPADEYPAWHKPGSAKDAYYTGMKMTYTDGKRYVCVAPKGYGVSYGPDVLPDMWQLVEEEPGQGGEE